MKGIPLYQPGAGGGGGGGGSVTMGGDCSGSSSSCTVVGIQGVPVGEVGGATFGQALRVNAGATALEFGALPLDQSGATSGALAQSKVANAGAGVYQLWLSANGTNTFGKLTNSYIDDDTLDVAKFTGGVEGQVLWWGASGPVWSGTPWVTSLDVGGGGYTALAKSASALVVGSSAFATVRLYSAGDFGLRKDGDSVDFLAFSKPTATSVRGEVDAGHYSGTTFRYSGSRASAGDGGGWTFETQVATTGRGGDFTVSVGSGSTGYGRLIVKTSDNTEVCRVTRETTGDVNRVGIGVASPTCALDVSGSAKFTGSVTATSLQPTAGYLHNLGTWSKAAGAGGTLTLGGAEAAGMCVEVTGAPGADVTLSFPTTTGAVALVRNAMTNSARLTVSANSTNIDIGRGQTKLVYYDGSSLRSSDERLLTFECEVTLSTAGAGDFDTTICKLPANCLVQEAYLRGSEAVAGGTSAISVGVSGTYAQLLKSASAPAVNSVTGLASSDLGTDMSTNGQAWYSSAQTVTLRNTASAALSAGKVKLFLVAKVLP